MAEGARKIVGVDVEELIKELNKAYCDEWIAYYFYDYLAKTVSGPGYEDMEEFLSKIAKEEREHIDELAERITELGGLPVSDISQVARGGNLPYPEVPASTSDYKAIINKVIEAERGAIEVYQKLAEMTFGKDHITYQLICHILDEEVNHEEMFDNLKA